MRRRTISAFLCAAVIVLGAPATAAINLPSTYELQITTATNLQRLRYDLVSLRDQSCVKKYAVSRAKWMAEHRQLKHTYLPRVMDGCGYSSVAENIATGFPSGYAAVSAWMGSSSHRKNILTSKWRYIGTGARKDSRGVWWVAEIFAKK
jgi:uncharacterized protein YkwD